MVTPVGKERNSVLEYTKRLGKSIIYGTFDAIKEQMPMTAALIENNKETAKQLYKDVLGSRQQLTKLKTMQDTYLFKPAEQLLKNLKADLKSGVFYHPERAAQQEQESMKSAMEALLKEAGMEDLMDLLSGEGDMSESEIQDLPVQPVAQISSGDALIATSIVKEQRGATQSLVNAQTSLVEAQIKTTRTIANMQFKQMQRHTSIVTQGLENMTLGLNAIISFNNDVVLQHAKNAMQYFETMTNLTQENNAILKEMVEMKRNTYKKQLQDEALGGAPNPFKNGAFDLKAYLDVIKSNVDNTMLGQAGMFLSMIPALIAGIVANPVHYAAKTVATAFLGPALRMAMKGFDQSINGYIQMGLTKMADWGKRPGTGILGELAKLFGVETKKVDVRSINISKNIKEPRSWDGEDHYYLTKVIPSYLSNIESALTGAEARLFDMQSGKWNTRSGIMRKARQQEQQLAESNLADIRQAFYKDLTSTMKLSEDPVKKKQELRQIQRGIDDLMLGIQKNGGIGMGNAEDTKGYKDILANKNGEYGSNEQLRRIFYEWARSAEYDSTKRQMFTAANGRVISSKRAEAERRLQGGDALTDVESMIATNSDLNPAQLQQYNRLIEALEKANSYNDQDKVRELQQQLDNLGAQSTAISSRTGAPSLTSPLLGTENLGTSLIGWQEKIYDVLVDIREGRRLGGKSSGKDSRTKQKEKAAGFSQGQNKEDQDKLTVRVSRDGTPIWDEDYAALYYQNEGKKDGTLGSTSVANAENVLNDKASMEQYLAHMKKKTAELREKTLAQRDQFEHSFLDGLVGSDLNDKEIDEKLHSYGVDPKADFFKQLASAGSIGAKIGVISANISKITNAPRAILTSVLMTADKVMYDFMFGKSTDADDPNAPRGLFGKMSSMMSESAQNLSDKISNIAEDLSKNKGKWMAKGKAFLKEWFDIDLNAVQQQAEDFSKPFKEGFKQAGKDVVGGITGALKGTLADMGIGHRQGPPIPGRAYGQYPAIVSKDEAIIRPDGSGTTRVKKSGVTAISDQDLILNARQNPWNPNRMSANLDADEKNENRIRSTVLSKMRSAGGKDYAAALPGFAEGKSVNKLEYLLKKLDPEDYEMVIGPLMAMMNSYGVGPDQLKDKVADFVGKGAAKVSAELGITDEEKKHLDKEILQRLWRTKALRSNPMLQEFLAKMLKGAGYKGKLATEDEMVYEDYSHGEGIANGMGQFVMQAIGTDPSKAMSETKKYIIHNTPELMKGGMAGALIGTVFPLGGPLFGALAGSAVQVLANNKSFMNYVFGTEVVDQAGNKSRKNDGIISTKFMKSLEKYIPDMKKYGITGSLLGLVTPFGPIGGLMAGMAASYIKNNENARNFLFGDSGGLLNKDRKAALKKALPKVALPLISTMLLGPWGLLGNAIVGSSLGLFSTTEMFKKIMLGAKDRKGIRHGGLAGAIQRHITNPIKANMKTWKKDFATWFRDDVTKPLGRGLKPIVDEIKIQTKKGMKGVMDTFLDAFTKASPTAEKFFDQLLGRGFGFEIFGKKIGIPGLRNIADMIQHPAKFFIGGAARKLAAGVEKVGRRLRKGQLEKFQLNDLSTTDTLAEMRDLDIANTSSGIGVKSIHDMGDEELAAATQNVQALSDFYSRDTKRAIEKRQAKQMNYMMSTISDVTKNSNYTSKYMDIHTELMDIADKIQNLEDESGFKPLLEKADKAMERAGMSSSDKQRIRDELASAHIELGMVRKLREFQSEIGGSEAADESIERIRKDIFKGTISREELMELLKSGRLAEYMDAQKGFRQKELEADTAKAEAHGDLVDKAAHTKQYTAAEAEKVKSLNDNTDALRRLTEIINGAPLKWHEKWMPDADTEALLNEQRKAKVWADHALRMSSKKDKAAFEGLREKAIYLNADRTIEGLDTDEGMATFKEAIRGDNDGSRLVTRSLIELGKAYDKGNRTVIKNLESILQIDSTGKLMSRVTSLTICGMEVDPREYETINDLNDEEFSCALQLVQLNVKIDSFDMFRGLKDSNPLLPEMLVRMAATVVEKEDGKSSRIGDMLIADEMKYLLTDRTDAISKQYAATGSMSFLQRYFSPEDNGQHANWFESDRMETARNDINKTGLSGSQLRNIQKGVSKADISDITGKHIGFVGKLQSIGNAAQEGLSNVLNWEKRIAVGVTDRIFDNIKPGQNLVEAFRMAEASYQDPQFVKERRDAFIHHLVNKIIRYISKSVKDQIYERSEQITEYFASDPINHGPVLIKIIKAIVNKRIFDQNIIKFLDAIIDKRISDQDAIKFLDAIIDKSISRQDAIKILEDAIAGKPINIPPNGMGDETESNDNGAPPPTDTNPPADSSTQAAAAGAPGRAAGQVPKSSPGSSGGGFGGFLGGLFGSSSDDKKEETTEEPEKATFADTKLKSADIKDAMNSVAESMKNPQVMGGSMQAPLERGQKTVVPTPYGPVSYTTSSSDGSMMAEHTKDNAEVFDKEAKDIQRKERSTFALETIAEKLGDLTQPVKQKAKNAGKGIFDMIKDLATLPFNMLGGFWSAFKSIPIIGPMAAALFAPVLMKFKDLANAFGAKVKDVVKTKVSPKAGSVKKLVTRALRSILGGRWAKLLIGVAAALGIDLFSNSAEASDGDDDEKSGDKSNKTRKSGTVDDTRESTGILGWIKDTASSALGFVGDHPILSGIAGYLGLSALHGKMEKNDRVRAQQERAATAQRAAEQVREQAKNLTPQEQKKLIALKQNFDNARMPEGKMKAFEKMKSIIGEAEASKLTGANAETLKEAARQSAKNAASRSVGSGFLNSLQRGLPSFGRVGKVAAGLLAAGGAAYAGKKYFWDESNKAKYAVEDDDRKLVYSIPNLYKEFAPLSPEEMKNVAEMKKAGQDDETIKGYLRNVREYMGGKRLEHRTANDDKIDAAGDIANKAGHKLLALPFGFVETGAANTLASMLTNAPEAGSRSGIIGNLGVKRSLIAGTIKTGIDVAMGRQDPSQLLEWKEGDILPSGLIPDLAKNTAMSMGTTFAFNKLLQKTSTSGTFELAKLDNEIAQLKKAPGFDAKVAEKMAQGMSKEAAMRELARESLIKQGVRAPKGYGLSRMLQRGANWLGHLGKPGKIAAGLLTAAGIAALGNASFTAAHGDAAAAGLGEQPIPDGYKLTKNDQGGYSLLDENGRVVQVMDREHAQRLAKKEKEYEAKLAALENRSAVERAQDTANKMRDKTNESDKEDKPDEEEGILSKGAKQLGAIVGTGIGAQAGRALGHTKFGAIAGALGGAIGSNYLMDGELPNMDDAATRAAIAAGGMGAGWLAFKHLVKPPTVPTSTAGTPPSPGTPPSSNPPASSTSGKPPTTPNQAPQSTQTSPSSTATSPQATSGQPPASTSPTQSSSRQPKPQTPPPQPTPTPPTSSNPLDQAKANRRQAQALDMEAKQWKQIAREEQAKPHPDQKVIKDAYAEARRCNNEAAQLRTNASKLNQQSRTTSPSNVNEKLKTNADALKQETQRLTQQTQNGLRAADAASNAVNEISTASAGAAQNAGKTGIWSRIKGFGSRIGSRFLAPAMTAYMGYNALSNLISPSTAEASSLYDEDLYDEEGNYLGDEDEGLTPQEDNRGIIDKAKGLGVAALGTIGGGVLASKLASRFGLGAFGQAAARMVGMGVGGSYSEDFGATSGDSNTLFNLMTLYDTGKMLNDKFGFAEKFGLKTGTQSLVDGAKEVAEQATKNAVNTGASAAETASAKASKLATQATKSALQVTEDIGEKGKAIMTKVVEVIDKVKAGILKYMPSGAKGFVEKASQAIIKKLSEPRNIATIAAKIGRSTVAGIPVIGWVISAGFVAAGAYDGYRNAEEILEIPEGTATPAMKGFAAFIGAITGAPILMFIPASVYVSLLLPLAKLLGFDTSDLEALRKEKQKQDEDLKAAGDSMNQDRINVNAAKTASTYSTASYQASAIQATQTAYGNVGSKGNASSDATKKDEEKKEKEDKEKKDKRKEEQETKPTETKKDEKPTDKKPDPTKWEPPKNKDDKTVRQWMDDKIEALKRWWNNEDDKKQGKGTGSYGRGRFGRFDYKAEFDQYDLSGVDEFNKPDFENDSGTVLRAKLDNLRRLGVPKKLGTGRFGRFDYKAEFDKYDLSQVDAYNRPDFENDSITVLRAKLDNLKRLGVAKRKFGTGHFGRFDYKAAFDQYDLSQVDAYNRPDFENDSITVLQAKLDNLKRLNVPKKHSLGTGRFGRFDYKTEFDNYDLSQVDEFNKPDFENDSGTVLRAKLDNLRRLGTPKKFGTGRFGRFDLKSEFDKYDLSKVDAYNRPDFENDSITVLRAKLDNIKRLNVPKKYSLGTGRFGRFDYKAEFNKYDLSKVDEFNKPDFENDSITVLQAKLDNLKRLGTPKKFGTGRFGRFDYKAEFDQYDLSQVDAYNRPDFDNDSITVLQAKLDNLRRLGTPKKLGTGRFGKGDSFDPFHVKQTNPLWADWNFNKSGDTELQTVGDSLCGPSTYQMARNRLMGTTTTVSDMRTMVKDSLPYKGIDDGVSEQFMVDEAAKDGMKAHKVTSRSEMAKAMNEGKYVSIMGNWNNTGMHWKGAFDPNKLGLGRGTVMQDDPESDGAEPVDSNELLAGAKSAVILEPDTSGRGRRHGRGNYGRFDYKAEFDKYDLSQVDEFNKPDFENDSITVLQAKLDNLRRLGTPKKFGTGNYGRFDLKAEFDKYDLTGVDEFNKPDFENDSITVLQAKLDNLKRLGTPKKFGTGRLGRFDYKAEFDKYDLNQVDAYNRPDFENDSGTVLRAKLDNLRRLGVPKKKLGTGYYDRFDYKAEFDKYDLSQVDEFNKPDFENDSGTVLRAKLDNLRRIGVPKLGRGTVGGPYPNADVSDFENPSIKKRIAGLGRSISGKIGRAKQKLMDKFASRFGKGIAIPALYGRGGDYKAAAVSMSQFAKTEFNKDVPEWFWRTILRSESTGNNGPMTSYQATNWHNYGGMDYESWMRDYGGTKAPELSAHGHVRGVFPDEESGLKAEVAWFCRPGADSWWTNEIDAAMSGDWEKAIKMHVAHYVKGQEDVDDSTFKNSVYYSVGKEEFDGAKGSSGITSGVSNSDTGNKSGESASSGGGFWGDLFAAIKNGLDNTAGGKLIKAFFTGIGSGDSSSGDNGAKDGGGATSANIKKASEWAKTMVGKPGFGDNGCTEFVKRYLLQADSPVGKLMENGSSIIGELKAAEAKLPYADKGRFTLMWVPTLAQWAKDKGLWKEMNEGGAEGDIGVCLNCGHVVIYDGQGGYWGNSTSLNQIVHSDSFTGDYNQCDGFIKTGSGQSKVSTGKYHRTTEEEIADAGSSNTGRGTLGRAKPSMSKRSSKKIDRPEANVSKGMDYDSSSISRSRASSLRRRKGSSSGKGLEAYKKFGKSLGRALFDAHQERFKGMGTTLDDRHGPVTVSLLKPKDFGRSSQPLVKKPHPISMGRGIATIANAAKDSYISQFGRAASSSSDNVAIWEYLKKKGLSNVAAAGVMGNFQAESSMRSDLVEGGTYSDKCPRNTSIQNGVDTPGYGLPQFTWSTYKDGLIDYANSKGKPHSDWQTQIDFLFGDKRSGFSADVLKKMDETKDPYKAALVWHSDYERSRDSESAAARRGEYAKKFFETEGKAQIDGDSSLTGNSSSGNSGGGEGGFWGQLYAAFNHALRNTPAGKLILDFFGSDFSFGGSGNGGSGGNSSNKNASKNGSPSTGGSAEIVDAPVSGSAAASLVSMMGNAPITSHYGPRGSGWHSGVDLGVADGTKVPSPIDAEVDDCGSEQGGAGGYGHYVVLKDYKGYYHIFGHLSDNSKVRKGQKIKAGTIIALSGHSGHCIPDGPDGAHVHYGIYPSSNPGCSGKSDINPETYSIEGLATKPSGKGTKGRGYKIIKIKPTGFTRGTDSGTRENIEGRGTSFFGRGTDAAWKEDLAEVKNMDMPKIPFQLKSAGDKNFNITPEETKMAGLGTKRRFGRRDWKYEFGQYDLSQVDTYNRPDFENDSITVLRAKLDNLKRLNVPKKLGTGRFGRFDFKSEFDQYDLSQVDTYNRPDFENDSLTVLRAKLENLRRLRAPKKFGTGYFGRFDYKAEFDKYDLSQVDEFNKPDFENDSGTVLRAKLDNLRRLGIVKKFGTGSYGRFDYKSAFDQYDLSQVDTYNRPDFENDSITVLQAKLDNLKRLGIAKKLGTGRFGRFNYKAKFDKYDLSQVDSFNRPDFENDSITVLQAKLDNLKRLGTPKKFGTGRFGRFVPLVASLVFHAIRPHLIRFIARKIGPMAAARVSAWVGANFPRIKKILEGIEGLNDLQDIYEMILKIAEGEMPDFSEIALMAADNAAESIGRRYGYGTNDSNRGINISSLVHGVKQTPRTDTRMLPTIMAKADNEIDNIPKDQLDSAAKRIDWTQVPEYNRISPDDSIMTQRAKIKAAMKQRSDQYGRATINFKSEFDNYDLSQVDEFNKPDFENDSITVLQAKLDNIKRLGTPKKHSLGIGRFGRFDYKAEFDKYDLSQVDEFNKPDFENDNGTVLRAKLDNLRRLRTPKKKFGTGSYGRAIPLVAMAIGLVRQKLMAFVKKQIAQFVAKRWGPMAAQKVNYWIAQNMPKLADLIEKCQTLYEAYDTLQLICGLISGDLGLEDLEDYAVDLVEDFAKDLVAKKGLGTRHSYRGMGANKITNDAIELGRGRFGRWAPLAIAGVPLRKWLLNKLRTKVAEWITRRYGAAKAVQFNSWFTANLGRIEKTIEIGGTALNLYDIYEIVIKMVSGELSMPELITDLSMMAGQWAGKKVFTALGGGTKTHYKGQGTEALTDDEIDSLSPKEVIEELHKYDLTDIPEYNHPKFETDDINVLKAKLKVIVKQGKLKDEYKKKEDKHPTAVASSISWVAPKESKKKEDKHPTTVASSISWVAPKEPKKRRKNFLEKGLEAVTSTWKKAQEVVGHTIGFDQLLTSPDPGLSRGKIPSLALHHTWTIPPGYIPDKKDNVRISALQSDKKLTNKKAPNGLYYEQNDVDYLVSTGVTEEQAYEILAKDKKYTEEIDEGLLAHRDRALQATLSRKYQNGASLTDKKAPNGLYYEKNDLEYLMKQPGMTEEKAYDILSKEDKYTKEATSEVVAAQEKMQAEMARAKKYAMIPKTSSWQRARVRFNPQAKDGRQHNLNSSVPLGANIASWQLPQPKQTETVVKPRSTWAPPKGANPMVVTANQSSNDGVNKGSKKLSDYKAPNGLHIEQNDIDYLVNSNEGMTEQQAVEILNKEEKYTKEVDPTIVQAQEESKRQVEKKEQKPRGFFDNIADWGKRVFTTIGEALGITPKKPKEMNVTEVPETQNESIKLAKKLSDYKAPNGLHIEQNDIDYLVNSNEGMTEQQAVEILNKEEKYTKEVDPTIVQAQEESKRRAWLKQNSLLASPTQTFNQRVGQSVVKGKARVKQLNTVTKNGTRYDAVVDDETKTTGAGKVSEIAPNGKPYEENDIQYLMDNGYSREDAITLLSKHEKYAKKAPENPIKAQKTAQDQRTQAIEMKKAEVQRTGKTSSSYSEDKMDILISEQKQTNQLLGAILKAITGNAKEAEKAAEAPKPALEPRRPDPYAVAIGAKDLLDRMAFTRSGGPGYMTQIGNNPLGIIGVLDTFSAKT